MPLELVRPRVLALRAAGVSQRALGAAAGCSATHIRDIELGRFATVQRRLALRLLEVRFDTVIAARTRPDDRVPAIGAIRRVGALLALGHTHAAITAAGGPGWNSENVTGNVGRCWTFLRCHEAARAAYEALSGTPGTSVRTRFRALATGYAPPLCWDDEDLDDPAATPHGVRSRTARREVLDLDEFMRLVRFGESPARAAERSGVGLSAVEQAARRAKPLRRDVLDVTAAARYAGRHNDRAA
jgi:hypothetical protein